MMKAPIRVGLRLLQETLGLFANRAPIARLLAVALLTLSACGGSSPKSSPLTLAQVTTSDGGGETVTPNAGPEVGALTKIVAVGGGGRAVVGLFPDGRAYYSPDGFNLAGGGSTVSAYSGNLKVIDVVGLSVGVDALLSDGSVSYSPDGMNIGGGASSVAVNTGTLKVATLTPVGTGVDATFVAAGGVVYSPDGRDFSGQGTSIHAYSGSGSVLQIIAVGPGDAVVTLFADGTTFYSPNNRDLGGGGSTISATPSARSLIKQLVAVGGGVLAQFSNGAVYLSPDGKNLAGGGASVLVPAWNTKVPDGTWPARDSAHGTEFLDKMWLSGGFADPTYANSCFSTCSFFDLWSSTDSTAVSWNTSPSFATASTPDPRDTAPIENNGVQDVPVPTDFYDSYSAIVVWNGQLTAIGATIWRSPDGVHWTRQNLADGVTAAPGPVPIRADENSRAVVLGAALYFLQPDSGEVFQSVDPNAAVWSDLGPIPGFTARCATAVFVLDGKIWVVGGGACDYSQVFNDTWSSPDGVNWTQSTKPAAWSARMWPCVVMSNDGVAWLAGGYAPTDWTNLDGIVPRYGANHSDVWYSKDGSDWQQFKADDGSGLVDDGGLEPRHAPTCYFANGSSAGAKSLVIMAGTGGVDPNDAHARVINSIRVLPLPVSASLP